MPCLIAAAAAAQGPVSLLADLETSGVDNPGAFYEPAFLGGVTLGSYLYFAADADGHGYELWRTDGAVGSASLVVDLNVGGGCDPKPIGVVGGWLLFLADDGIAGRELWRTDGTAAGTALVKDITPGPDGSQLEHFVLFNNRWWFTDGFDLWSTDGTTGNTIALSIPLTGIRELAASGNALWLLGDQNGTDELWWTTGVSLPNLAAQLPNGGAEGLVGLPGSRVVFAYDDGVHGSEPWTSDGTIAGTTLLVDLAGGPGGSGPSDLVAWNGEAWFAAYDGAATRLYRSNGTAAGTTAVDTAAGPRFPQGLAAAGGHLFFEAAGTSAAAGYEPWVTDGTAAGTHMVLDVWPGTPSSGAGDFAYDGTQWTYFRAHDGVHGYELWRTDLTTTQLVSDIQPGFADSSPVVLGFRGIYCVFAALHTPNAFELYSSSGNSSQLVADLRDEAGGSSYPEAITPLVDGRFWFTATHPTTGREPHGSSGLVGSGQLLVDTVGGTAGGTNYTTGVVAHGDHAFFNSMPGAGLWRSAITPASTNAIPGVQAVTGQFVAFAGQVWFTGRTAATGDELFAFANPLGAPALVKDLVPGAGSGDPRELCVVASRLFFFAHDPSGLGQRNLWLSDGTAAGTQQVWVNGTIHEPQQLRALGRRAIWSRGSELVVSDGTAAGTAVIGSFYAAHERVVVGDRMFFVGYDTAGNTGEELCVTDGATVSLVADVRPGAAPSRLYGLCAFGDGVLFCADDGVHGTELWRSDGTAAGTQMVLDLRPGPISGCVPDDYNGVGSTGFVMAPAGAARALFAATDGQNGVELWHTDGTAAGTALHVDLQPGPLGSWPGKPVRCGSQLVFAARRTTAAPRTGRELYAAPAMAFAEPVGDACAATLASTPLAAAAGTPRLGNAGFALTVDAVPGSGCLYVIGAPAATATAPCDVHVGATLVAGFRIADAGGHAALSIAIPNSTAFAGMRLMGQWAMLQAGGPYLGIAALSNGVDFLLQAQ